MIWRFSFSPALRSLPPHTQPLRNLQQMIRIDGGGLIGQRGDAAVRPFHVSEGIHSKMQKHAEAPIHLALLLPGTIHSFRCLVPGEWFYLCFSPEWAPAFRESCRALRPSRPVFTSDPTLARQLLAADGGDRLRTKGLLYLLCRKFRDQAVWQPAPK